MKAACCLITAAILTASCDTCAKSHTHLSNIPASGSYQMLTGVDPMVFVWVDEPAHTSVTVICDQWKSEVKK